eukprot:SAG11_NODE_443_length_9422_cov_4.441382_3_plen_136_part_00
MRTPRLGSRPSRPAVETEGGARRAVAGCARLDSARAPLCGYVPDIGLLKVARNGPPVVGNGRLLPPRSIHSYFSSIFSMYLRHNKTCNRTRASAHHRHHSIRRSIRANHRRGGEGLSVTVMSTKIRICSRKTSLE